MFDIIDIMHYILSYISEDALSLKPLILCIYQSSGMVQYISQLYMIYSSYMASD
jgi:hypothetical protein